MIHRIGNLEESRLNNVENLPTTRGLLSFLEMRNALSYNGSGSIITDLSGNGNNGVINGALAIDTDKSLVFNGVGTYIATTISNALFSGGEASVSLYLKLDMASNSNSFKTGFIGYNNNTATRSHYPYIDGRIYADTFRTTRVNSIVPSGSVTRTNYHQITITTKSGGSWKMYQNNILIKTDTAEAAISFLKQWIGRSDSLYLISGNFFSSMIYNVELTPTEISNNITYNQAI